MTTQPEYIHLDLDVEGPGATFYAYVLASVDPDFPLEAFSDPTHEARCATCGGVVWKNPLLGASDLKVLARQLSSWHKQVKVRIHTYMRGRNCK